jgi:hypothetical protein
MACDISSSLPPSCRIWPLGLALAPFKVPTLSSRMICCPNWLVSCIDKALPRRLDERRSEVCRIRELGAHDSNRSGGAEVKDCCVLVKFVFVFALLLPCQAKHEEGAAHNHVCVNSLSPMPPASRARCHG